MIPFIFFLFCLSATYAVFLMATRKSGARRDLLQQRLNEALLYSSRTDDAEVSLARSDVMSEMDWANRMLVRVQAATQLKRYIGQADLNLTVMRLLLFSGLAGMMAALAASTISISLLMILVSALVAAALPFMHVMYRRHKRLHAFLTLLPDALELMARALSAGHGFSEALNMVGTEMPEPISTEFRRTYEEQNLGLSLKLALQNFTERIPLLDLRMCVTAILIQRETGGNLAEILERVAHTIRDRFRIKEDLKTLTTSSRMSAWLLCAIPLFVALMATYLNPDYMRVLWADPRGHNLIGIALLMQITGMLIVRKILRIKI